MTAQLEREMDVHAMRMERGSDMLANALRLARGEYHHRLLKKALPGDDLIWSSQNETYPVQRTHGHYSELAAREMERNCAIIAERKAHIESLRVSRDPCPMCGVRGDVGCKHRRIAA